MTHHPLYLQGDYNTVDKKPAAVISDALTILSSQWNDANSTLPSDQRIPVATTINAAVMGGRAINAASGSESMLRLLEHWAGVELRFAGSDLSPWGSHEATSDAALNAYRPPNRVWSFDTALTDLSALPPGTPLFFWKIQALWTEEQ